MTPLEDQLAASMGRYADQVTVSADAWTENQRRLTGRRGAAGRWWVVPAVAAAVVAVVVSVSLMVVSAGPDRRTVAGPAITLDDRHFGDPALEHCAEQIRTGTGDIAQVPDVDPGGGPIVFRLADETLCTMFSAGGDLVGPDSRLSDDVPFFAVTGGTDWMAATGGVASTVDRITFTPETAALATIVDVPTVRLGSLRAFAMRLPGAGTVRFFSGDAMVGESAVGVPAFDPSATDDDDASSGQMSISGAALLVPEAQRLPVATLSGGDVVTGVARALDTFRGRPLVVNVWGSWCTPCRDQQAELNRVATALDDPGVPMLGLDVDDDRTAAAAYLTDLEVAYPSMVTTPDEVAAALPGVPASSVPVTLVIDRQQRVAQVFASGVTADQIISAARALAAE